MLHSCCVLMHQKRDSFVPSMQYCLSDKPEIRPFDPVKTAVQPYPITDMQPMYFLAESFKDAREKIKSASPCTAYTSHAQ